MTEIDDYMKDLMRVMSVPEHKLEEQGVLAELLEKIVSKEDGEFLIKIGKDGGTAPELAEKLKMDKKELTKFLNDMFVKQGIIHPEPHKGTVKWRPTGSMLLHDLVFMNPNYTVEKHSDLLNLLDQYYEEVMAPVIGKAKHSIFRVIPVNEMIKTPQTQVLPYEEIENIIKKSYRIALADCVCRKRARRCDHPSEVCLSIDLAAEMVLQRNFGKKISKEKALEVLRISEEAGLVHCVDNKQKGLLFVCNCCSCACGAVRAATVHGYTNAIVPSRYRAVLDPETCIGCGNCIDKCQFNALTLDDKAIIDPVKCYGCGNCATNCPENAIKMEEIRPPEHIPEKGVSFMGF